MKVGPLGFELITDTDMVVVVFLDVMALRSYAVMVKVRLRVCL